MDNRGMDIEMEEGKPPSGYRAEDLERIRRELSTAPRADPVPAPVPAPPPPPPPGPPRVAATGGRNAKKS